MQTKRIKCPKCGVVLDVKNSRNETIKQITCPSCSSVLQVKFEQQQEPIEAHTYYAPKTSNENSGATILATAQKSHKSAILVFNGLEYPIETGENIVGRKGNTSKATIQIPTEDRFMSRQHCRIIVTSLSDGSLKATLSDYQNKNMTSVNGQTINQGDEIRLSNDDKITMGNTTITFKFS